MGIGRTYLDVVHLICSTNVFATCRDGRFCDRSYKIEMSTVESIFGQEKEDMKYTGYAGSVVLVVPFVCCLVALHARNTHRTIIST